MTYIISDVISYIILYYIYIVIYSSISQTSNKFRKIFLKYHDAMGSDRWLWNRTAFMSVGPDAKSHLEALPWTARPEAVVKMFSPIHPTRVSMWACLMGMAFKQVPGAVDAWRSGRATPELFRQHAERLKRGSGSTPHIKFVWKSILQELQQ